MMKETCRPLIAITMGDPAGVGPELCLKVMREPAVLNVCVPVVFGDARVLGRVAERCGISVPPNVASLEQWTAARDIRAPAVVDCTCTNAAAVVPGKVSAECGHAAYTFIETSIKEALAGRVAAVATAPIHKESLNMSGVRHPGHTEIFTALTGAKRSCMMLASEEITTSFVTTHVAVSGVSAKLTVDRICDVIKLTDDGVKRLRGRNPRIAVCGLNPHAGEHGLFGGEEQTAILPAIEGARANGIDVTGPLPPDAAFIAPRRKEVDAYVCMYHDQGHIPFKMLAFDTGVNITLGLPIIRTSVDHGTAFDIAWTGRATTTSMVQAILYAARLAEGGMSVEAEQA